MLFVVHGIDRPDSLPLRLANRDAHLAYAATFDLRVAGPLLDDAGDMCGSLIVVDLPDQAAADAFIANDPYRLADLFSAVSAFPFTALVWP